MLFGIDKIKEMWCGNKSSFSMTMTTFFSDDDSGLDRFDEEYEAAFDKAAKEAEDRHFRAHCEAALKAEPNNPLLREAIEIGLSLL